MLHTESDDTETLQTEFHRFLGHLPAGQVSSRSHQSDCKLTSQVTSPTANLQVYQLNHSIITQNS